MTLFLDKFKFYNYIQLILIQLYFYYYRVHQTSKHKHDLLVAFNTVPSVSFKGSVIIAISVQSDYLLISTWAKKSQKFLGRFVKFL